MGNDGSPLVVSFRAHHNAHQPQDGSGAEVLNLTRKGHSRAYNLLSLVVAFVLIHYFLWFIPMALSLYLPIVFGVGWISLIMLTMYLRTFFRPDELRTGRPWDWFRTHKLWSLLQHYAGLEVVREAPLDPDQKYIFASHPHGILILSRIATYGGLFEKLFPGIEQRCLGATPMFNLPGSREICLWMGAVRADRTNAAKLLSTTNIHLLLYPGGSDEIFLTEPSSKENVIIGRKGFIRLALEHGCNIVPSFVFGEKHVYHKMNIPAFIKSFFMKKLRTPLIIFWGRFFTWLPLQGEKQVLSVVYGKPIKVEKVENPSNEAVDELYEKFYGEIRRIFEQYKGKYGYSEDETLVIRTKSQKIKSSSNGKISSDKNGNACTNGIHKNGHVATTNGHLKSMQNGQNGH